MKYGCIGAHLPHSFSKEIHGMIGAYEYCLQELTPAELPAFMAARDFTAINVTIPYKQDVIPFLDEMDEIAKRIGAVNTIVNRNGKLYGYNTDFSGMTRLIIRTGLSLKNKKVLILGTGGTSKTAYAVAQTLGARQIVKVSRSEKPDAVSYAQMYEQHADAEIIINTTPCGMYPDLFRSPVALDRFPELAGVIDAVYNPLRTELVSEASRRGLSAAGGLFMLVAQAVAAYEIFMDRQCTKECAEMIFRQLCRDKENIVLTGMPGSGKSTVGKLLAERTGRRFIDVDDWIVEHEKRSILEIFSAEGEAYFRNLETAVIRDIAKNSGMVIATGGGAVLRDENVRALKMNGKLYFLDRLPEKLCPSDDRPLAQTRQAIEERYKERLERYLNTADVRIPDFAQPSAVTDCILEEHGYENPGCQRP